MPGHHPVAVPELAPIGAGRPVIRLPEVDNVPVTRRVLQVIDHVQREVKQQTGIELETEIIVVGE